MGRNDLRIKLPADPIEAQNLRQWAVDRGINLIAIGSGGVNKRKKDRAFPYLCRHGHMVAGPTDEFHYRTRFRAYRYCLRCWQRRQAENYQKRKAKAA